MLTDFAAGNEPDIIQFFTDINSKTLVEKNKVVSIDEITSLYLGYGENINTEILAAALGHIPHYLIENFILAEGGTLEHNNRDIESVKDTW